MKLWKISLCLAIQHGIVYNESMKIKDYYDRKIKVLTHYGDGKLVCKLCGFDDIRALSIDHINGGGAKHIKSLRGHFYDWLIENDFPEGYRTLCMNCQWITKAQQSRHILMRRRNPIGAHRAFKVIFSIEDLAQSSMLDWVKR